MNMKIYLKQPLTHPEPKFQIEYDTKKDSDKKHCDVKKFQTQKHCDTEKVSDGKYCDAKEFSDSIQQLSSRHNSVMITNKLNENDVK